jgi:hypothetical protein
VPDESAYIAAGDPGMFLHEHFLYFTQASLRRLLNNAGFRIISIGKAGYGGAIYCAAAADTSAATIDPPTDAELGAARWFPEKCREARARVAAEFRHGDAGGPIGIYCPARGLALMPLRLHARFFDDDPELSGLYYPPFDVPMENRAALLQKPVGRLLILSRTFGAKLKAQLEAESRLRNCTILTIEEVLAGRDRQQDTGARRALS